MFLSRMRTLGEALSTHNFDAMALLPSPSLYYLTGLSFHLQERPIVGLFTPQDPPLLILPELERGKCDSLTFDLDVIAYGEDQRDQQSAFEKAIDKLNLERSRIGVEPTKMRYLEHQLLQAAAIGASFAPGNEITASLRILKTEVEVQAMRQATSIAETALKAAIPLIKMGMTERELASELVLQLLQAGSLPEFPFDPIVASGPNSAIPHAVPSSRKLQPGDLLIIDWGARVNGYTSDLTRTFSLAEIEPEFRQVHAIVHSANAAGKAGVKPGASCESVDQAARDVIDRAGYGEYFLHRTGHGLGLEAHEPPYITDGNTEVLAPGMTFTIEPGIYLPGRGGVRIEDDVLVTAEGVECLSAYPRELEVIL